MDTLYLEEELIEWLYKNMWISAKTVIRLKQIFLQFVADLREIPRGKYYLFAFVWPWYKGSFKNNTEEPSIYMRFKNEIIPSNPNMKTWLLAADFYSCALFLYIFRKWKIGSNLKAYHLQPETYGNSSHCIPRIRIARRTVDKKSALNFIINIHVPVLSLVGMIRLSAKSNMIMMKQKT